VSLLRVFCCVALRYEVKRYSCHRASIDPNEGIPRRFTISYRVTSDSILLCVSNTSSASSYMLSSDRHGSMTIVYLHFVAFTCCVTGDSLRVSGKEKGIAHLPFVAGRRPLLSSLDLSVSLHLRVDT
jgi:hypothetical protein